MAALRMILGNCRTMLLFIMALCSMELLSADSQPAAAGRLLLPLRSPNANILGSNACSSTLYRCPSNGRCIPKSWLCDGDNDCGGAEDEQACAEKKCEPNEYKCISSSKCIPERWLCDAEDDCGDNSDEAPAQCANRTCSEGRFKCPNSTLCIPKNWVCDTQKDCENGEDEANCTQLAQCSNDEFKCKSGRCIFQRWRCDHDDDCGDMSDEQNCEYTCGVAQFKCESVHRCIPGRWQCDGERDCPDASDEKNCFISENRTITHSCRPYEFACDNGACIHSAWECDGDPDCPDGSDEMHCTNRTCSSEQFACSTTPPVQCIPRAFRCNGIEDCQNKADEKGCLATETPKKCDPFTQFDCGDGTCIRQTQVCDRKYDCPKNKTTGLFADEAPVRNCAAKEVDRCKAASCDPSAVCVNTILGALCKCRFGYQRSEAKSNATWLVCEDVNECASRPKKCGQNCYNTIGSFRCTCHQGYMLSRDGIHCRGLGEHPKLLFSHRTIILEVDLRNNKVSPLIDGLESAVAMDYFDADNTIVWSDVAEEKIYSLNLTKAKKAPGGAISAKKQAKVLVKDGLSTPDGLAVDWVHGLIFWTDTGKNTISVADAEGKYRKTLFEHDLDEPRAIAVDPIDGLIFWTDWGKNAKIERAAMDGTHRSTIIDKNIVWPNGLAVDLIDKRIFWADAKLKTITSADYNGKNVEVVLTSASAVKHPFSLAVFEEKVYWTDWDTEGVHSAHKYTGETGPNPLTKGLVGPMAIRVRQEMSQPKAHNKCGSSPCAQLCLPSWVDPAKTGMKGVPYTCACADGYQLENNGLRCIGNETEGATNTTAPLATTGSKAGRADEQRSSRTAFVTVAFIACVALAVAFIAYAVWRHMNKNTRRPKLFTLQNPVYHRTVVDGGMAGDHYDHFRLPMGSDHNHSNGLNNGFTSTMRGSGVYQPTTTMSNDDAVEPDAIGVGIVQSGKYSMKLPLTEHEEGPDYA